MVTYLSGPDGVRNTGDDIRFGNLEEARLFLGVSPNAWSALTTPLSIESPVIRMLSTGQSGPITTTLSTVVNRAAATQMAERAIRSGLGGGG
mgnify:CR=1 FL=1